MHSFPIQEIGGIKFWMQEQSSSSSSSSDSDTVRE